MIHSLDFVDDCYMDKDLSLLKKLTLVIPTFNRDYLKRCLWYHAHFPFGQIIVADSSFDEKKIENWEIIAKIRNEFGANILHLEYQPETEKYGGDIYRKWGDAVQHVETEYVQFCTDKAFRIPTTQNDGIAYLDEHQDYIAAESGKLGYISTLDKEEIGKCKLSFDFRTIPTDDEDALIRFKSAINNGWAGSVMFAVTRTAIMRQIYSQLISDNINDIRYGEFYISYTGHILGKIYKSNTGISAVRDVHAVIFDGNHKYSKNKKSSTGSSTTRYPYITDFEYFGENDGEKYKKNYFQSIYNLLLVKGYTNDIAYRYVYSELPIRLYRFGINSSRGGEGFNVPLKFICNSRLMPIFATYAPQWIISQCNKLFRKTGEINSSQINSPENNQLGPELIIVLKIVIRTDSMVCNDGNG